MLNKFCAEGLKMSCSAVSKDLCGALSQFFPIHRHPPPPLPHPPTKKMHHIFRHVYHNLVTLPHNSVAAEGARHTCKPSLVGGLAVQGVGGGGWRGLTCAAVRPTPTPESGGGGGAWGCPALPSHCCHIMSGSGGGGLGLPGKCPPGAAVINTAPDAAQKSPPLEGRPCPAHGPGRWINVLFGGGGIPLWYVNSINRQ